MRNHFLTVVSRAAGVCLLSLIFCASALGQNNWINPAGGNYGVGANWSGGAVPLTPAVTTVNVPNPTLPALGSGEPVQVPVAGAIANAFFDATGVRITEAPMTPARVRATLKAAGVV